MIGFKDVYLFDDTNIREREQFLNMYLNLTKILNIIVFKSHHVTHINV